MAFKRHAPKHQRSRETIRRKWCPFCDGMEAIASMVPSFGIYAEGQKLPFRVDVVERAAPMGVLAVRFTFPDKTYRVFKQPEYDFDYLNSKDPAYPVYMDAMTKTIEQRKQQFAFPINHCPMCGRKFKNNRSKLWR